jgi:hypothetical protein
VAQQLVTAGAPSYERLSVRQHHVDVEHFQVALAVQRNLDVVGVDLGVLGDHLDQFLVQRRQEVRTGAAVALARDDDLQPLLGRGRFSVSAETGKKAVP